jgi:hypothetical protein
VGAVSDLLVFPEDFGAYLSLPDIDENRAEQVLRLAQSLCESIVTPLPSGADAVILDVAARAWTNPGNAQSMTTGPYSASYGPASGGLWLTRQNKATLRRLSGSGGAFSIDVAPSTVGQALPWWDNGYFYGAPGSPPSSL